MGETLHDCPDFGGKNFTKRGLKSHNCGRRKERAEAGPSGELTVLPPETGKGATVALYANIGIYSEDEIVARVESELDAYDRCLNLSVYAALRSGLMLVAVRDGGKHGDMTAVLRRLTHRSERTLKNHIRLADLFLKDCGLGAAAGAEKRLEASAPLLEVQLDLFTQPPGASPKRVAQALERARAFVAGRGVMRILRDQDAGERSLPPDQTGTTRAPVTDVSRRQSQAQLLRSSFQAFTRGWKAKYWAGLEEEEMAHVENVLRSVIKDIEQLAKARRAKGGRNS